MPAYRQVSGLRLRAMHEEASMTQTAPAAAADLDRSFYVEIEHARHGITPDRIYTISQALGIPIHELFADD